MKRPLAILLLLVLLTTTVVSQTGERREPELRPLDDATAQTLFDIGMMPFQDRIEAEDFTLALLDGSEATLSDFEGSFVFLNFWATWCPPCREEMPSMQELYDEFAEDGLEMLAVNVLESRDVAAEFIESEGFTYPVLLDVDGRVMLRWGVRAYPTTYLIDRDGYVIATRPGYHDWSAPEVMDGMRELVQAE